MPFDDQSAGRGEGGGGDNTRDIATVMFFLRGAAEDQQMFNTYTGREAFDAFARLLKTDPDRLWEQSGRV